MTKEKNECGIPIFIKMFESRKISGKPEDNSYAIVQFAHENSALRALAIASRKANLINGKKVRVYRLMTQFEKSEIKKETAKPTTFNNVRGGAIRGRGRGGRK